MGRPLSDKFWGNFSQPGFQMRFEEAWIPGEASATTNVEVLKQTGTRKYIVRNTTSNNEGIVFLVNGSVASPGDAHKRVYPWTGQGSGATVASLTFQVIYASVVTGGTGYTVGNVLTVNGGTGVSATLTVTQVSSGGSIIDFNISNNGNYTVIPTNLNNNAVTGGSGTGASFKLTMGLNSATLGLGGTGYANGNRAMAIINGSGPNNPGKGGVLLGNVVGGSVTSWSVIGRGFGYTNATFSAQVFGIGPVEYARTILKSKVKTWQGSSYIWSKNNVADGFNKAVLVTI